MSEKVIEAAKAKRLVLKEELRSIEKFISDYYELAGEPQNHLRPKRSFPGGPKAASDMILLILKDGAPKTRGEIADALKMRGLEIVAKDTGNYVGTIIWRFLRDRIEHSNLGYQLKQIEEAKE